MRRVDSRLVINCRRNGHSTLENDDMSSPAIQSTENGRGFNPKISSRFEANGSQEQIRRLKLLVGELQQTLESLNEVRPLAVAHGVDFYEEVSHFEIELIRHALILVGGHQGNAARLLRLNAKTLSAKIKHYHIKLGHHSDPRERPRGYGSD